MTFSVALFFLANHDPIDNHHKGDIIQFHYQFPDQAGKWPISTLNASCKSSLPERSRHLSGRHGHPNVPCLSASQRNCLPAWMGPTVADIEPLAPTGTRSQCRRVPLHLESCGKCKCLYRNSVVTVVPGYLQLKNKRNRIGTYPFVSLLRVHPNWRHWKVSLARWLTSQWFSGPLQKSLGWSPTLMQWKRLNWHPSDTLVIWTLVFPVQTRDLPQSPCIRISLSGFGDKVFGSSCAKLRCDHITCFLKDDTVEVLLLLQNLRYWIRLSR